MLRAENFSLYRSLLMSCPGTIYEHIGACSSRSDPLLPLHKHEICRERQALYLAAVRLISVLTTGAFNALALQKQFVPKPDLVKFRRGSLDISSNLDRPFNQSNYHGLLHGVT